MSDRRWPSFAEIEAMESTEAYDLYWHLPAPSDAGRLAIIRALGDQAWKMRQEEDGPAPKRAFLPMPERPPEVPVLPPKRRFKPAPKPAQKDTSGAQFFLNALRP
jgi:hypothetical protein